MRADIPGGFVTADVDFRGGRKRRRIGQRGGAIAIAKLKIETIEMRTLRLDGGRQFGAGGRVRRESTVMFHHASGGRPVKNTEKLKDFRGVHETLFAVRDGDGAALGLVCVEKRLARLAIENGCELPCEILGIDRAGVEAEAACR